MTENLTTKEKELGEKTINSIRDTLDRWRHKEDSRSLLHNSGKLSRLTTNKLPEILELLETLELLEIWLDRPGPPVLPASPPGIHWKTLTLSSPQNPQTPSYIMSTPTPILCKLTFPPAPKKKLF